eukprot:jgi/Psemu1/46535/gm1.46535_g
MPATAFDWNQIKDIAIQFGTFNAKDNAHKHEDLNKTFGHDLEYTDGLFITDDDAEGPKTLAPDPVPMLREIIRLRNKHLMDKAGELAIANGQDTILIEIRATHWGFKPDWDAIHFAEVYDTNIYSFPKKSNTREATTVANKTPNASRTRFANLPQRKYIQLKAVPLQRKHIKPQAVPPNTANLGPLQPVGSIADTPSVQAPCYIWTWTYSPNSDSVSFRRVQSDSLSFKRATSFSPPIQHQDKSLVTAPLPSPKRGHHSALPWGPTNFGRTFNPQNEIVTLRRLAKPALSPQSSLRIPLLVPSEALAAGTDLPHAAPAYIRSLQSPCRNQICSKPNHQPVLRLFKRHWDALKVKLDHLYANILSMNWFYDTFD